MISLDFPVVFIGDLHGNHCALRNLISQYIYDHHMVFLGDFFNNKNDNTTVVEIAEIVRMVSELETAGAATVLHSNHNELVLSYLQNKKQPQYRLRGWAATQAYLNGLDITQREWLTSWLASHRMWEEFQTMSGITIAAAHAYVDTSADKFRKESGLLTIAQKKCIGIGTRYWWTNKQEKECLYKFDQTVIGHFANVGIRNRLVLCDLGGHQVPVWDPQLSEFTLY